MYTIRNENILKHFNNGLGFPLSVTAHEIESNVNATRHPCHDIIYAHLFPGNGKREMKMYYF